MNAATQTAGEAEAARAKILVVDDRPENLFAMRKLLETTDAEVVVAQSGQEALRAILHHEFALVLLDVQMPGMDGLETARHVRANPGSRHVPIIFVTAIDKDRTRVAGGYDAGAVDYIFKPIEPAILEAKVRVFLELWRNNRDLRAARARLESETAQRRHAERSLRVAQRLEALGRLVAGVAHEVNNPLTYVLSSIESALYELSDDPSRAAVRDMLEEAQLGAERIKNIVRSLKRFSMLPGRTADQPCDVGAALDLAARMVGNQIRARGRLVVELESVPPVRGDPGLLEQVFLNLLMNALESLPEPGDNNEVRVATRGNGSEVEIIVQDSGRGIEPEALDRIFDPFFTTKAVGSGTGLGLSICHEIVTSLGGGITVRSSVGQGTTVRITLPAMAERRSLPPATAAGAPEAAVEPMRVLVVDDEPLILRALSRQLVGHEVTVTEDADEAIALAADRPFDLILCDLIMPRVSGIDVYERLSHDRPGVETRIVFMTGGAFTPTAHDFLERVDNRCLTKPIDRGELRALVQQINQEPSAK